ncbi:MAG: hypothetical protein WBV39_14500 [Rudaea sp.]
MPSLLILLRDICLLRRGPQDLPYSPRLLITICVASLALQWLFAQIVGIQDDTLPAGLLGLGFNMGVLYLLLSLRGLRSRFVQAQSALLLCALLFLLLTLPVSLIVGSPQPTGETVTSLQMLVVLAWLPIMIWKVVVDAHILRHSLDLPFFGGLIVAIVWLLVEYRLVVALGGGASAGA